MFDEKGDGKNNRETSTPYSCDDVATKSLLTGGAIFIIQEL